MSVFRATFHVCTAQHSLGRCSLAVLRHVVPTGQEVAYGTAVTGYQSLEAPLVAQDVLLVTGITAAGITVYALVGTHHLGHVTLLYQRLEGWQIGFPQVSLWQLLHVEHVAVPLWSAMHGKVFGASQEFLVLVLPAFAVQTLALQSVDHGQSHALRQVRVFTVGLLSASPARVAEYVDVRSPERQALITLYASTFLGLLVLGTCFVAGGRKDLVHQFVVPRCCHHRCDGEYGCETITADAV